MASDQHKKALRLSYFTVGYNLLEGLVSIFFGMAAGSFALIGFGADSFIESLSGSVMIWRFRQHGRISHDEEEKVEAKAVKLIAYAFFILGAYVLFESVRNLILHEHPEHSLAGILIAIASLIVMPVLFSLKRQTGKSIKSKSLLADSKQTLGCMLLSAVLLAGLGLNYLWGLWWADPLSSTVIAILLLREGYETYRERELCEC
jgi:cation diffusion facilitator family transporter